MSRARRNAEARNPNVNVESTASNTTLNRSRTNSSGAKRSAPATARMFSEMFDAERKRGPRAVVRTDLGEALDPLERAEARTVEQGRERERGEARLVEVELVLLTSVDHAHPRLIRRREPARARIEESRDPIEVGNGDEKLAAVAEHAAPLAQDDRHPRRRQVLEDVACVDQPGFAVAKRELAGRRPRRHPLRASRGGRR